MGKSERIRKTSNESKNYENVSLLSFQAASPRWEPQIALLCEAGQQYHPQHLSEDGRWVTDLNIKTPGTTCLRDKMDLLDYCKKVCAFSFHLHFPTSNRCK